jgi:hypothetical protein
LPKGYTRRRGGLYKEVAEGLFKEKLGCQRVKKLGRKMDYTKGGEIAEGLIKEGRGMPKG